MDKFHVNLETGDAGKCSAVKRKCPFGGEADHYTSAEAARTAYEAKQDDALKLVAARNSLERFGESSPVFKPWGKIHSDFKINNVGSKSVLANDNGSTVLAPWYGPKVLEQLQAK